MGSDVAIYYDGNLINNRVLYQGTYFEQQANAVPGICEIRLKDTDQTLEFSTGRELLLTVDGDTLWRGYLTQVGRQHAFEADEIPEDPGEYTKRIWVLRGADQNILFDKRVFHNPAEPLEAIDTGLQISSTFDGTLITHLLTNYVDLPAGFDASSQVENVATMGTSTKSHVLQQGTKLREQLEKYAWFSGAVWYISDNTLHWHALESVESPWGFSDQPDNDSTFGFREVDAVEDGSLIVNDSLVWGGSAINGAVFSRVQDTDSINEHNRWQLAETHFGEEWFGNQAGVDARANVVVYGPPGATPEQELRGLRYSQWSFHFGWFADRVPSPHLRVGDLVRIEMNTFGVTRILPLRSLRMTFVPEAESDHQQVRFDGDFALNMNDPFTLWRYLLDAQNRVVAIAATAGSASSTTIYGAIFQGQPTPLPNGSTTVFSIQFGYIGGTLEVYLNGLLQSLNSSYAESDPENGEFTMTFAPDSSDNLWVRCRTLES